MSREWADCGVFHNLYCGESGAEILSRSNEDGHGTESVRSGSSMREVGSWFARELLLLPGVCELRFQKARSSPSEISVGYDAAFGGV